MKIISFFAAIVLACISSSSAAYYLNEDFSTYADGDLVGQKGWAQFGTSSTSPLTIAGGKLVSTNPVGNTVDNQDAQKAFSTPSGALAGTTIYEGFQLSVTGKGNNNSGFVSSYLTALLDQNATPFADIRTGFNNVDDISYQVAARINGQSSNPFSSAPESFAFGSGVISFVIGITLADGSNPDTVQLWVNPTSVGDPSAFSIVNAGTPLVGGFQALVISQFTKSSDLSINRLAVADSFDEVLSVVAVPEPATLTLFAVAAGAAFTAFRRKRNRA